MNSNQPRDKQGYRPGTGETIEQKMEESVNLSTTLTEQGGDSYDDGRFGDDHRFSRREVEDVDDLHYTDEQSIKDSIDDLRNNFVTKEEFIKFARKMESQQQTIISMLRGECTTAFASKEMTPEVSSPGRPRSEIPQMQLFCSVEDGGATHTLTLPKSVIMRIEAARSKRGIVKDVLRYLHPEAGFFEKRTITGIGGNNRKDSLSRKEVEPLPALTVKYCIAAVNRVKPLDITRFREAVVAEEQEKYDNNTREEVGRAIIDLRSKDYKAAPSAAS